MNLFTIKELISLSNDIKADKERTGITVFVQIELTKEQIEIIAGPIMGLEDQRVGYNYYKNKLDGNILLAQSVCTTREEQPDFQFLVNYGIKAISMGIDL